MTYVLTSTFGISFIELNAPEIPCILKCKIGCRISCEGCEKFRQIATNPLVTSHATFSTHELLVVHVLYSFYMQELGV